MLRRAVTISATAAVLALGAAGTARAAPPSCPGVGAKAAVAKGGGAHESIAFDGAGRLLSGDLTGGRVRAIAAPGAAPETVARVRAPGGIAALPGGGAIVASGNGIGALVPGGGSLVRIGGAGAPQAVARGLTGANGLARAADGTVYTSDPLAGVIDRVAPDGTVRRRWWRGGGGPNGLALAADGRTLFASLSFAARIVAIDIETGAARTVARAPSDRRLALLDGLAADGADTLYVAAYLAGEVWRVAPGGAICTLARGLRAPTATAPGAAPFAPRSLYVTALGAVWELPGAVSAPAPPSTTAPAPAS